MKKLLTLPLTACAMALGVGLSHEAQAVSHSYAFAWQKIENLTVTRQTPGAMNEVAGANAPDAGTSAVVEDTPGGSETHFNDEQSYVGPLPRPAEDTFSAKGKIMPDYARGDVVIRSSDVIGNQAVGGNAENVAESYLAAPISGAGMEDHGRGEGTWTIGTRFTLGGQDTPLDIDLDYMNEIHVQIEDPFFGTSAQGKVEFTLSILEHVPGGTGIEVFSWVPIELNQTHQVVGNISDMFQEMASGPLSTTTPTLLAGREYELTISGGEEVNTTLTGGIIPEPLTASLGLMGLGALAMFSRRRPVTA